MWIMLNDAFFSIVSKDCARDEVLVRARRKGDIEKVFVDAKVKVDRNADYFYRAPIKRAALSAALAREVERVTYPNFKDSVADRRLHDAYLRVWAAMLDLQPARWPNYAGQFIRDEIFGSLGSQPQLPLAGKRKYPKGRRSRSL